MKRNIFLALFFALATLQLSAHALWIETAGKGKKGQAHTVKVFYGEYADFSPDKVADWYSDVKDFKLWLLTPDGKKEQLDTKQLENHFESSFIPSQDGAYTLMVSHEPKDLGGTTKYQFNTSAQVLVGVARESVAANGNPFKLSVEQGKAGLPVVVKGFFNDTLSDTFDATIFSPRGWTKQIKADKEAKVSFTPEWKGTYMIEISRYDKDKGKHNDAEYDGVWRCATYLIDIK